VKKSDRKLQIYCDYQGLDKITQNGHYPILYINYRLDRLHGAPYFTKLDLASGYYLHQIHKDDRHKTSLIAPEGLYELKVIPL
jgi:hypothetical protein